MNRPDWREWLDTWADVIPVFAVAAGIILLFAGLAFSALNAQKPGAPCEQLGDVRVADLPARCAQYWRIR